ncbi:hypothetical protein [Nocardia harenae]|uniref:hypothetical protein n=1 Tax=Nocardia harenae TaxID=358707 RepID=UPI000A9E410F|nr:hypothetical protein [Nocardia harenae]
MGKGAALTAGSSAAGGRMAQERRTIAGAEHLIFFAEQGGNAVSATQNDAGAR